MTRQHIHFVTGRLAEPALRRVVAPLADAAGFDYTIDVLGITVAALMTPQWIAPRLRVPAQATRVLLPGYCEGDLAPVESAAGKPVARGPKDLRELPEYFGHKAPDDYGEADIEILAEINHAPRLPLAEIRAEAHQLRLAGADVIDVGCDPGETWAQVADCIKALLEDGHRVSIDSYNVREIEPAVRAGAELVLSVNATNREAARDWGCEVVAVPDRSAGLEGLEDTVELLTDSGVPLRIDPVLEPIGIGLAASLGRYLEVRRLWPDAEMMMGIGNLTELTDADSAGINVLLLGFCQELGIRSVLTTQVINWARTSVQECDLARRLVHYAVNRRVLPKHIEPRLVMLRDARPVVHDPQELTALAESIRDHNFRVFAEEDGLHLISAGLHLVDADPFVLLEQLLARGPKNLDASHAFYLGYELAKALTARTLGKTYRQDEALDWGYLTVPERRHAKQTEAKEPRRPGGTENESSAAGR